MTIVNTDMLPSARCISVSARERKCRKLGTGAIESSHRHPNQ